MEEGCGESEENVVGIVRFAERIREGAIFTSPSGLYPSQPHTEVPLARSVVHLAAAPFAPQAMNRSALRALCALALLFPSLLAARTTDPPAHSSPLRYLNGTLILKLRPEFPNRRNGALFGIDALDRVLERLGATGREPLFPLAPWSSDEPRIEWKVELAGASPRFDRTYVIRYSGAFDAAQAARDVAATGTVVYCEPHYIFEKLHTPNDPLFSQQALLSLLDLTEAWDLSRGDTNVVIAIVDDDLSWRHQDLVGNIARNPGESGGGRETNGVDDDGNGMIDDVVGWDMVGNMSQRDFQTGTLRPDNDPDPLRINGVYIADHGTKVGGCASATTNNSIGVAAPGYRCRLLGVKCAPDSFDVGILTGYEGIRYAADRGARVINCSWGGELANEQAQAIQEVIDYAVSKGALVVAAAGNSSNNNDEKPFAPSNLRGVLSVGATTGLDSVASFSHYGLSVGVWAPGVNVLTTQVGNSYAAANVSGTSFSSPIVAGIAALVFSQHPTWTPEQVAMQLHVTGEKIKVPNATLTPYFFHRVNAFRALAFNATFDGSSTLPGLALQSYTINGKARDTIKAIDTYVPVELRVKNLLAPGTSITIDAAPGQVFQIERPATITSIGTMEEVTSQLNVRIPSNAPVIYSEGAIQLVLHVTNSSGIYEDYMAISIPVVLPGWRQTGDPERNDPNLGALYQGTSVSAVSTSVAWASANIPVSQASVRPVVARTLNGTSWSNWISLTQQPEPVYCVMGLSSSRAWAGTSPASGQAAVYRTTNGTAWTRSSVSSITDFVNGLYFWDENNGLMLGDPLGNRWGIGTSSDGGQTWTPLAAPLTALNGEAGWNNSVEVVGDTVWFGGNNGRIYRSLDRGFTWTSFSTPQRNILDIAFLNGRDGAVRFDSTQQTGGKAGLAVTRDGGETWKAITLPYAGAVMSGLTFLRGTTRLQVGTQRGIFETSDFGSSWHPVPVPRFPLGGFVLDARHDSATGRITGFGINGSADLMTLRDTTTALPTVGVDRRNDGVGSLAAVVAPNPATRTATVTMELPTPMYVEVWVGTALGQIVEHRQLGLRSGTERIDLDVAGLPAGTYYVTVDAAGVRRTLRLVVAK